MDAAIQKKVGAIVIWPLDPKGIQPSFEKAKAAGIPVFTMWSRGEPNVTANFQYNDGETAATIAKMVAAELKKQGKPCNVGIIQGIPVVTILKTRNDGLLAGAKAAGCTVLEQIVNQKDNSDGAQPIASAWKAKYGSKMTAVLAYNDPSAMGTLATVGGDFNPIVTGFNGDSIAVDAVKSKRLFLTAANPNVEIGNAFAWAIDQIVRKKKKIPTDYEFKYEILTQANVGKYVSYETRNKSALTITGIAKNGKYSIVTETPNYSTAQGK
jgi:ribose transport system substrate-binding protein